MLSHHITYAQPSFAALVAISLIGLVGQALPLSVATPDTWTWAEHVTLSGAMVVAIAVLWRALQAKDSQLVSATKTMAEALAATASSNHELRKIIEDSVTAKRLLTESIDLLRKDLSLTSRGKE